MNVSLSGSQWGLVCLTLGLDVRTRYDLWRRMGGEGQEAVTVSESSIATLVESLAWPDGHAVSIWDVIKSQTAAPTAPIPGRQAASRAPQIPVPTLTSQPQSSRSAGATAAPMLTRFLAEVLDGLVFAVPAAALVVLLLLAVSPTVAVSAAVLGEVAAICALLARRGVRNGQTLGKGMFGLRVVCLDGSPVTWKSALLRELVGRCICFSVGSAIASDALGAPVLTSLWFLIWYLVVPLANQQRRAPHDYIAGTRVVTA